MLNKKTIPELVPRTTPNATVSSTDNNGWRLEIPPGPAGIYRLAQLDDYPHLYRWDFPWKAPCTLSLQARASSPDIPGTWGFGFWNDPFSISFGFRGGTKRLPALPQAAWFFFASSHNYLSIYDNLPACGYLASTYKSLRLPSLLNTLSIPVLPLLAIPPAARLLRSLGRHFIFQDTTSVPIPVQEWHKYTIELQPNHAVFMVDQQTVLGTSVAPAGVLGLILWVDNQYAALPPSGRLRYGTLANPQPAWIEITCLTIGSGTR